MRSGISSAARLWAVTWLFAAALTTAAAAAPSVGQRISVMACPYTGVTSPCLMIKGADGTVYNITAAAPKPPLNGRMIRLRGTVTDKLSACAQGTVLERVRWSPVREKCAP
jgi:hypothetical protein